MCARYLGQNKIQNTQVLRINTEYRIRNCLSVVSGHESLDPDPIPFIPYQIQPAFRHKVSVKQASEGRIIVSRFGPASQIYGEHETMKIWS